MDFLNGTRAIPEANMLYMKCSHCGSTKNLKKYSDGGSKCKRQYFYCRKCNMQRARKYRKTEKGIIATRKAVETYERNNPKRKYAWGQAAYKIETKPCIKCGAIKSHKHHPDINKPLEIIHLCPLHHKQIHMQDLL